MSDNEPGGPRGVHADGVRWTRPPLSTGGCEEVMYHVISTVLLDRARSEGLQPGTTMPGLYRHKHLLGETQEHVYLWDSREAALRYALRAWGMDGYSQTILGVSVDGLSLERDPYFHNDRDYSHRWRGPTGEIGAYRVLDGHVEPRRISALVEIDTDDESSFDAGELYGQDERNWPEAGRSVPGLTPEDLPLHLERLDGPSAAETAALALEGVVPAAGVEPALGRV